MTVLDYVISTVRRSGLKSHELATLTNTSDAWVRMVLSGKIENPSLDRLERLYTAVTGKPIIPDDVMEQ